MKIRVLFICHGNICRSPAAEYIMKEKTRRLGISEMFVIESRATSSEEIGNDIYYKMKRTLDANGIPYARHRAKRITMNDYDDFDLILLMDRENEYSIKWTINDDPASKIHLLTEFTKSGGIVDDPWYTGRFQEVFEQIDGLIDKLIEMLK